MNESVLAHAVELKACPLCGSHLVELIQDTRSDYRDHWEWFVECGECETRGPFRKDRAEAIAAWNRRTPSIPAHAVVTDKAVEAVYRSLAADPRCLLMGDEMKDAIRSALQAASAAQAEADKALVGAISEIAAERRRQVEEEGYDAAHDDQHMRGELAKAAACYAVDDGRLFTISRLQAPGQVWPYRWDFKPSHRQRRNLIKAAALIAAEIERLDREAARAALQGEQSNG